MSIQYAYEEMQQQWCELCQRIVPHIEAPAVFSQLFQAYTEPHRAYHTIEHIVSCLQEFHRVKNELHHPDSIEWALWLHDVVYDTHSHTNEEQSAQLSETLLRQGGAEAEIMTRTTNLILATRHTTPPAEHDMRYLIDIDLAILGAAPHVFERYEHNIRREYAWVAEHLYREKRGEILSAFVQRKYIYCTPLFRARYEHQARANIQRSLEQL